jgi:hypothetical protein
MTGTIKLLSSLILLVILSGCMKTTCVSHSVWEMKCEKKLDWNNPGFTVMRTIITQGANAGN